MQKINTLFIGTSRFAVIILKNLIKSDLFSFSGIITQPDKPAGRKQVLDMPAIKKFASEEKLTSKIFQPVKISHEAENILQETKPDLIIVADYGQILPQNLTDYPKYKCLNIHGSLLPDLRGAAPVPMAILNGYDKTGVSIPIMSTGLDDGPVIGSKQEKIQENDTTASLKARLAEIGSNLLIELIPKWIKGEIDAQEQDNSQVTMVYTKDIAKDKAQIVVDTPILLAQRMIRAFSPWPIAWMYIDFNGQKKRLKVYSASNTDLTLDLKPGTIQKHAKQLYLSLRDGCLELTKIQLEGKKQQNANECLYLSGSIII